MPIRPLSPELAAFAAEAINEKPEQIESDLKYIKEWLKKQPHLNARTDDQWLVAFLRGCKYSLERTKEKLDMYYTMRTLVPEIYSNRDPMDPEVQEVLKLGLYLPLPKTKGPTDTRVFLLRSGVYNADEIDPIAIFKVNIMIYDIMLLEDDISTVAGMRMLQDMKQLTMSHITKFSPSLIKKSMTIFQEAYPARPKGLHFINTPTFFEVVHKLFSQFLKEKMKKRMNIHGSNFEELYESIPKSILPKEYGGDSGTLDEITDYWKKKVESYRDWFLDDVKYKSDEKKRPGKPKSAEDLFGIEGSFRQLKID